MNKPIETEYAHLLRRFDTAERAYNELFSKEGDFAAVTSSAEQEQKLAKELQAFQQLTTDEQQEKLAKLRQEIQTTETVLVAFSVPGYSSSESDDTVVANEPRSPSPEAEVSSSESSDQLSVIDASENADELVDDLTVRHKHEAGPFDNEDDDEDDDEDELKSTNSDEAIAAAPIASTPVTSAEVIADPESVRKPSKLEKKWHRLTEFKTHLEAAIIKAEELRKNIHALGPPESMNQTQKDQLKDYKIELLVVEGQFEVDQNDFKETLAAAEDLLQTDTSDISPELQATIFAMLDYYGNEFTTLQERFEQAGNEPPKAPQTKVEQYQILLAKLAEVHQRGSDLYAVVTTPQRHAIGPENLAKIKQSEQEEQRQIAASNLEKFKASTPNEQEEMIAAAQDEILAGLEAQQYFAARKLDFITATYIEDLTTLDRYVSRENAEFNYLQDKINKTNTDLSQRDFQLEQYAIVEEYVTEAIGSPEQYSNKTVQEYAQKILDRIETYFEKQEALQDKTTELQDSANESLADQSKLDRARDNSMQKNLRDIEKLNTTRENYYNQYEATKDKKLCGTHDCWSRTLSGQM